jgi:hypothetical protein
MAFLTVSATVFRISNMHVMHRYMHFVYGITFIVYKEVMLALVLRHVPRPLVQPTEGSTVCK